MGMAERRDSNLDTLLLLDGELFFIGDCYVKFVIKTVPPTPERPHGLSYSLTLHDQAGERLVGFDNAHPVGERRGSRSRIRDPRTDSKRFVRMTTGTRPRFSRISGNKWRWC